jgi:hypothetical protein
MKAMNWQRANIENKSVTIQELKSTLIVKVKDGKAPNEDEISLELYKHA